MGLSEDMKSYLFGFLQDQAIGPDAQIAGSIKLDVEPLRKKESRFIGQSRYRRDQNLTLVTFARESMIWIVHGESFRSRKCLGFLKRIRVLYNGAAGINSLNQVAQTKRLPSIRPFEQSLAFRIESCDWIKTGTRGDAQLVLRQNPGRRCALGLNRAADLMHPNPESIKLFQLLKI